MLRFEIYAFGHIYYCILLKFIHAYKNGRAYYLPDNVNKSYIGEEPGNNKLSWQ